MPTTALGLILAVAAFLTFRSVELTDGRCWYVADFGGPNHCIAPAVIWCVYAASALFIVAGVANLWLARRNLRSQTRLTVASPAQMHEAVTACATRGFLLERDDGHTIVLSRDHDFDPGIPIGYYFIPVFGWIAFALVLYMASRSADFVSITLDPDISPSPAAIPHLPPTPDQNQPACSTEA